MDQKADRKSSMPDYRSYTFSKRELAEALLLYLGVMGVLIWLFYNRLYLLPLTLPGLLPYLKRCREKKAEERRQKLTYEFRDALDCLSVSLKAGYSVENAFPAVARDLHAILGGESDMTKEMLYLARQSRLSVPPEDLLTDFGRRSGSEDIRNFAAVFSAAKRMGGDLPSIIRSAADSIGGRIDVGREVETALAAKRMEQKIMTAMPAGILLYMRLASPGFLDLMYTTWMGALIMTVCLLLYGAAVVWSGKIVAIQM